MSEFLSEKILPYVYRADNPITREYYFGSRFAHKVIPEHDIGIEYFTSSGEINSRKDEFVFTVLVLGFNDYDIFDIEQEFIGKHIHDPLCLNKHHFSFGEQKFAPTINKGMVVVYDVEENCRKRVTKEEYRNNTKKYKTTGSDRLLVKNIETDERRNILKEEYEKLDHSIWKSVFSDKVCAKNKITNEIVYVSKEEYDKDENLVGINNGRKYKDSSNFVIGAQKRTEKTKILRDLIKEEKKELEIIKKKSRLNWRSLAHLNKCNAYNTITGKHERISVELYKTSDVWSAPLKTTKNMVSCRDVRNNQRLSVSKEEFYNNKYLVGSNSLKTLEDIK